MILVAGQASEGRASLFYDFSLGAGVVLNDNLHLDPQVPGGGEGLVVVEGAESPAPPVKETIFTIVPGFTVAWASDRDRLNLRYSGEYSMYQGDEERDPESAHNVAADLNWRRWSPFLEVKDGLSRVPRAKETETEAYVDQLDRNLLLVRTGLAYEIDSRNTVELAYRGELDSYSVNGVQGIPYSPAPERPGKKPHPSCGENPLPADAAVRSMISAHRIFPRL